MANRSVQPLLHTSQQTIVGHVLSPNNNCPFAWEIWAPSNTCFLGPPKSVTQTASRSVQPFFAEFTSGCCRVMSFPPKNYPFSWGTLPHNTWFLGFTRLSIPSGFSIGSAVFAQLTTASLYFKMGRPFPRKIDPFTLRMLTPI